MASFELVVVDVHTDITVVGPAVHKSCLFWVAKVITTEALLGPAIREQVAVAFQLTTVLEFIKLNTSQVVERDVNQCHVVIRTSNTAYRGPNTKVAGAITLNGEVSHTHTTRPLVTTIASEGMNQAKGIGRSTILENSIAHPIAEQSILVGIGHWGFPGEVAIYYNNG
ncbi:hypothetical protein D3C86_1453910 [compost metagenome]